MADRSGMKKPKKNKQKKNNFVCRKHYFLCKKEYRTDRIRPSWNQGLQHTRLIQSVFLHGQTGGTRGENAIQVLDCKPREASIVCEENGNSTKVTKGALTSWRDRPLLPIEHIILLHCYLFCNIIYNEVFKVLLPTFNLHTESMQS